MAQRREGAAAATFDGRPRLDGGYGLPLPYRCSPDRRQAWTGRCDRFSGEWRTQATPQPCTAVPRRGQSTRGRRNAIGGLSWSAHWARGLRPGCAAHVQWIRTLAARAAAEELARLRAWSTGCALSWPPAGHVWAVGHCCRRGRASPRRASKTAAPAPEGLPCSPHRPRRLDDALIILIRTSIPRAWAAPPCVPSHSTCQPTCHRPQRGDQAPASQPRGPVRPGRRHQSLARLTTEYLEFLGCAGRGRAVSRAQTSTSRPTRASHLAASAMRPSTQQPAARGDASVQGSAGCPQASSVRPRLAPDTDASKAFSKAGVSCGDGMELAQPGTVPLPKYLHTPYPQPASRRRARPPSQRALRHR